jgi:hypothetical protein
MSCSSCSKYTSPTQTVQQNKKDTPDFTVLFQQESQDQLGVQTQELMSRLWNDLHLLEEQLIPTMGQGTPMSERK